MTAARIGILGGSFNPIHQGHLALASYAQSELNLDKVYFVPSFQTPLKDPRSLLPAPLRARLVERAIRPHPRFKLSEVELKRKGRSYTVDTLRFFKKRLGAKAQLYFLAGADNAKTFSRWKSPQQVLKLCRFVWVPDRKSVV